jgi:serine/threonine-protein kinase HipA
MAYELAVWLHSDLVGYLSEEKGQLGFVYLPEWLAREDALPLSISLPLQREAFSDAQCRGFFSGLLPEGGLRQLIAQRFKISAQNDFALLNAIGGECAGAVSFFPVGHRPADPEDVARVDWLNVARLRVLLDELPRKPMLAGEEGLRLSLAGAQDKLPIVFDGTQIGLPKGDQPSTHILKPAIRYVQSSVLNEAFCLRLARDLEIPSADAEIFWVDDQPVLLVRRYDRSREPDGSLRRLHQEDFCQALAVPPALKYQSHSGPSIADCFHLLRDQTRPSALNVLRLLDAVIFNALIGNHDAHAKNFSLLYQHGVPALAPLYDLLSTAVYTDLTSKMAMKIGSKYRFEDLQARHWDQFAQEAGLSVAQTRKRIVQFAEAMPMAAKTLREQPEFFNDAVVSEIVDLIEKRSARTLRLLT